MVSKDLMKILAKKFFSIIYPNEDTFSASKWCSIVSRNVTIKDWEKLMNLWSI